MKMRHLLLKLCFEVADLVLACVGTKNPAKLTEGINKLVDEFLKE